MDEVWAIVLAAGASTRMKKQKMLLPFQNSTIIETVIGNASEAVDKNILVVLGANWEKISAQIEPTGVKTGINKYYMNGMLSSVICGLNILPETAKAVLIFLGDQPQISGQIAKKILEAWTHSGKGIVIPIFNNRRGHPALIETKYKTEIEKLDPNMGLRSLYQKFSDDILEVECNSPEILRDIDTPEDYLMEINLKQ